MEENKTCKSCCQTLPTTEFYPGRQISPKGIVWDYFDSYCKKCRCLYSSDRRRIIKKQAVDYLGGECKICGLKTDRVSAYDFHHRNPDEKDFSIGKQAKSFETIKNELDKCDLLCAICHRFQHDGLD